MRDKELAKAGINQVAGIIGRRKRHNEFVSREGAGQGRHITHCHSPYSQEYECFYVGS